MINNRQAGRRRGRGGQRSQGNPNRGVDNGNRIDNRARGNASQLHEKYKTLARDAQMQDDRVNTEYYLQFADHYFRVLSETRSRQEENRRGRDDQNDSDDDDDFENDRDSDHRSDNRSDQRADQNNGSRRRDRGGSDDRGTDRSGADRNVPDHDDDSDDEVGRKPRAANGRAKANAESADASTDQKDEAPRRGRGRPRREPVEANGGEKEAAIEPDRLPPSLSLSASIDEAEEKPRRRRRTASEANNPAS